MNLYYEVTYQLQNEEGKSKPATTLVSAQSTAEAEINFAKNMSSYSYEITVIKKSRISAVIE